MIAIDMEMPKNCFECPMNQGEYTPNEIEKRYCCLTHRQFSKGDYKKRPTNCPMKNSDNTIRDALELLKKQEPKPAKNIDDSAGGEVEMTEQEKARHIFDDVFSA